MGEAHHRLGLTPASTSYTNGASGEIREVEVAFEDWTVDGTPLRSLLGWARPPQQMTPLCGDSFWPRVAVEHLRQLLGEAPGEFDDGRVAMLRCPIDADLGCAALSMQLVLASDAVTWSDFSWQNNYEPFDEEGRILDLSFSFDRPSYESTLRQTLARYAS